MVRPPKEWNPDNAFALVDAAILHIKGMLEVARFLRGEDKSKFSLTTYRIATATERFLAIDGLLTIEMALKGIVSYENRESMVESTHSTKKLYEIYIGSDSKKAIDAAWSGSQSFHEYMIFLDGKYEKARYAFAESAVDFPEIHIEDMFQAIIALRQVLADMYSIKDKCENCESDMIRVWDNDPLIAYCGGCGIRRPEYDGRVP